MARSEIDETIHVNQPAVSKTIGEIERGLGVKLFARTPRGLLPTAYGECLIRHARALFVGLNQARDAPRLSRPRLTRWDR